MAIQRIFFILFATLMLLVSACTKEVDESMVEDYTEYLNVTPLFLNFKEISPEKYLEKYGPDSLSSHQVTSAATKVARVDINNFFESDSLTINKKIKIEVFDERFYIAAINDINRNNNAISVTGHIKDTDSGYLTLSYSSQALLGSIYIPDDNAKYLLRLNNESMKYYLFKAPIDELEMPEIY